MDYEKKVAEALEELKQCDRYDTEPAKTILKLFPELEESDYVIKQRLRKYLEYFRCKGIDHNVCDRILKWLDKQDEQKPNPYSGTSFEYNGHTWGMCARDGGVETLIDRQLKSRVFVEDTNGKEMFIKALERVEEQNNKGYKLTDCDKNSWWEDFIMYFNSTEQESTSIIPIPDGCHAYIKDRKVYIESYTKTTPTDKIKPKFQTGDTMRTLEEARDGFTSGMPMIVSIDDEYYHCTNESIAIKDQDNYEYPPINRKEEKIKAKFKVNDWIVNKNGHAFLIKAIENDKYLFEGGGYTHEKLSWEFIKNADKRYTLWSLKDAEDGEILVHNKYNTIDDFDYIFIYNKTSLLQAYGYYSKKKDRAFVEDRSHYCPWNMDEVIMPATKEQRDFLRSKLGEIHFEWDGKNKIFFHMD